MTLTKREQADRGFFVFLFIWFLFNCIQSFFTGLLHDEAYYWMYSKHLDWGYFDHPPAVAVVIWLGDSMFHNELGVRFFIVVCNLITVWLLWKLCSEKSSDVKLFILMITSMVYVHAGGFIATPDVPLLLFTALFFIFYKKYILEYDLKNAFILAIIIAAGLYSKYHFALVILFTVLSNLKLITKRSFWIIVAGAFILYIPHLLWQINHHYPSIKFHISERFGKPYALTQTSGYIITQILMAGAISGIILFYSAFKRKPETVFEKTLKFNFAGVFFIFLLATFKGRAEANWTVIGIVPMLILAYRYLAENKRILNWFFISAVPVVIFLCLLRVLILFYVPDIGVSLGDQISGWDKWAQQIRKTANGSPVVFMNSYQRASKYTWFTGKPAYNLNDVHYRRSQYEFWETESLLQGKKIMLFFKYPREDTQKIETGKGNEYYLVINKFRSFDKIHIKPELKNYYAAAGDTVETSIEISNNGYDANFKSDPLMPVSLNLVLQKEGKIYYNHIIDSLDIGYLKNGAMFVQQVKFPVEIQKGLYEMMISLKIGNLDAGLQGDYVLLHVE